MPAPVVIEFLLRGMPAVDRAFRSVEQAATASDRAVTNAAQRGARQRQQLAEREGRDKTRTVQRTQREVERAYQKMVKDVERAANRERQIEARKEKEIIRAREQRARAVERMQEREMRKAQQWAERQVQMEQRAAQRVEQIRANRARTEAQRDERETRYNRNRFARAMAGHVVSGASRGISQVARVTGQVGGMFTQLGGGFSIADSVKQRGNIEREAALLSNQAFMPGDERFGKRIDPKKLIAQAKATGAATGMDTEEVIKGTRKFVNLTGDIDMAQQNQEFFAKVAKATGADMSDIAGTAGMLFAQNKKMTPAAMRETLLQVMMQANQGAVGVEDLAKVGGKLTKTSAGYAGDQTETQRRLLGLAQIGITTGGSANETQTMIANLSADTLSKRKQVDKLTKAAGMGSIFNEEGQITTTPDQLVTKMLEATGGNIGQIQSIYGKRSIKMFQAVQQPFLDAKHEAMKSGKTEKEASKIAAETVQRDIMDKVISRKYGEKDMEADVKAVLDSGSEQFDKSMRDLKTEVGEALIPEFKKLIPEVKKLTPAFVEALRLGLPAFVELLRAIAGFVSEHKKQIEFFARHPIGALIGGHIATSFAQAGLAEVLRAGFARVFAAQIGGQVVGSGAAPAAMAAGMPAGARVGGTAAGSALGWIGAGVAAQGYLGYSEGSRIVGDDAKAQSAIDRAAAGDATAVPQAIADAQSRRTTGQGVQAVATDVSRIGNYFNPAAIASMFASDYLTEKITGKENAATAQSASYHSAGAELKTLANANQLVAEKQQQNADALRENTAALVAVAKAASGIGGDKPGGPATSTGIAQRPK